MPMVRPCSVTSTKKRLLKCSRLCSPKTLVAPRIYVGVLRMFLVENGYFGDPDAHSLHKLLVVAYRDFKAFQKEQGIACSQTKFVPNFVPSLH